MTTNNIAILAVLATFIGSVGVIGQILVTKRQLNLQEAADYRNQAHAWRELASEWSMLVIVGLGPHLSRMIGLDATKCEEYERTLMNFRTARIAWHDELQEYEQGPEDSRFPQEAQTALNKSLAELEPYKRGVRAVLVHLAQLSDLVLRRRLKVAALYDAVGHDLIRDRHALTSATYQRYDPGGCPGPEHHEIESWKTLSLDEVSVRIGWGSALSETTGAASRIRALVDYVVLYGHSVGDAVWSGSESLAHDVAHRPNVCLRYRTITRVSRLCALHFCWLASGVSYRPNYEHTIKRIWGGLFRPFVRYVIFLRILAEVLISSDEGEDGIRLKPPLLEHEELRPEHIENEQSAA